MRFLAFFICLCLLSCKQSTNETEVSAYFDLKGFFEKESLRLSRINAPILKTVSRNNNNETRQVTVTWLDELSLFMESDINKPAWKNSYQKVSDGENLEYVALEDDLKTRKIKIKRTNNHVTSVHIVNQTSNFLYHSSEDLQYYPDSAYIIKKTQQVKLLGVNHYLVTGKLR